MRHLIFILSIFICLTAKGQQTEIVINQSWGMCQVGETAGSPAPSAPFNMHSARLEFGDLKDPFSPLGEKETKWIGDSDWELWLHIYRDSLPKRKNYTLILEGLDTYTTVRLDDSLMFSTDNMFRSYELKLGRFEKAEKILNIVFENPEKKAKLKRDTLGYDLPSPSDAGSDKTASFSRKAGYQFGWDWGPRMLSMGPWKPVKVIGWDDARMVSFRTTQDTLLENRMNGTGYFTIEAAKAGRAELTIAVPGQSTQKKSVVLVEGMNHIEVPFSIINPELWWPNGAGKQKLYEVSGSLKFEDEAVYSEARKLGVRSVELVNEPDDIGTSFYFKVNGEPIFMKGANMIPQSVFPSTVANKQTLDLLVTAKESHFNMLRVWGGGIYQSDYFYEMCDSLGIMVWQDAMFACAMYPSDDAFVENVKVEIEQQVSRISDHACIATWCGNNEIDVAWQNWGWQDEFKYSQKQQDEIWAGYEKVFKDLIPNVLDSIDPKLNYISTSPLSNWGKEENFNHHNMHYWGVWHGNDSFDGYQKNVPRFMSEYGFQSFPHFFPSSLKRLNGQVNQSVLETRQRSYKGNKEITKHLEEHFAPSRNFHEYVYLSQLTQRLGMKTAIEAHRLNREKCMGTLYWQFNDVWQAPTWSTIDFNGNWKAAHYTVVDRYKPIIPIAEFDGSNFKVSVSNDRLEKAELMLKLKLQSFTGEVVWEKEVSVSSAKSSVIQVGEWASKELFKNPGLKVLSVMRMELFEDDSLLDEELFYFDEPKNLILSKTNPEIQTNFKYDHVELVFTSPVLLKDVMVQTDQRNAKYSENFFDVLPNEPKTILVYPAGRVPVTLDVKMKSLNQFSEF
ncbi:MAG: beta-mannosidase [Bacteroidia bacterium]|jgi:beta-mannosidase